MATLEELAARCEAATGHDRSLDAAIQRALGDGSTEHWFADHAGRWVSDDHAPSYTKSFDAAVTLLPFGFLKLEIAETGTASALALMGPWTNATTAPLAICAAALKARLLSQGAV